jgi:hypothetical protein
MVFSSYRSAGIMEPLGTGLADCYGEASMGHPVVSWQIVTKNPDGLTSFYTKLFDWTVNADNPLGYRMIETGSDRGISGGIWPAPPTAQGFVQLFIEVNNVQGHVEKAVNLGGKVIIPPQSLPDGGVLAILHDPEGIPFGLFRPGRAQA